MLAQLDSRGGSTHANALAALVGMLLVAVVGVILNWPWWLEYALIVPSAVWLIVGARLVVYRQLSLDPPGWGVWFCPVLCLK
jgi:membrane protein implicated in regulation of membrane protease activity